MDPSIMAMKKMSRPMLLGEKIPACRSLLSPMFAGWITILAKETETIFVDQIAPSKLTFFSFFFSFFFAFFLSGLHATWV